jgi:Tol biopolymer transport system component
MSCIPAFLPSGESTMRARTDRGRRCRPALAAACLLLPLGFLVLGCDAVQENRSINVSPSGQQAAFQHGSDGIFVADPRTGEMRKVFEPDPTIIAVSSPLWSADESRAVFTTARAEPQPATGAKAGPAVAATAHPSAATPAEWDDAPTGRYFFATPIVYTCWQLGRAADGSLKPVSLFEAHCGHAGYVAGNWAVRQQPRGEKILFIDREAGGGHAVWSFDVKTREKSRLFPPADIAAPGYVLCDYSPDGSHIACTVGRDLSGTSVSVGTHRDVEFDLEQPPPSSHQLDGIWIQPASGAAWRHVAQSSLTFDARDQEGLAPLIGRRPTFSADGSTFAFARPTGDVAHRQSLLFRGRAADHKVEQIFSTAGAIVDPHWSTDGARLGFVDAKLDGAELTLIDTKGKAEHPAPHDFVRGFAGWNSAGDELAFVRAEHAPPPLVAARSQTPAPGNGPDGSPLLWPDPWARDALVVSKGGQSRVLLAGLRLTFPQWSPGHETISVWGTFTPSYESWANQAVGRGLGVRAGDPAAVIDVASGNVRWLAINGDEQAQIGHYLQLKRDFAGALEWYRRAEKTLPKLEPLNSAEFGQGVAGHVARRRTFEFLLWHCLAKLGKDQEAAPHLAAFEQAYHLQWPSDSKSAPAASSKPAANTPATPTAAPPAPLPPEARRQAECLASVLRALTEAQVLLSVDDAAAATDFFNHKLEAAHKLETASGKNAVDPTIRLGDLLALTQLDLLSRNFGRYLQHATNDLGPLVVTTLEDRGPPSSADTGDPVRFALADGVGRGLSPLFVPRTPLLRDVPADQVAQAAARWRSLRSQCHSQSARLLVDLILRSLLPEHDGQERGELNERIAKNPALNWFQWNVRPLE